MVYGFFVVLFGSDNRITETLQTEILLLILEQHLLWFSALAIRIEMVGFQDRVNFICDPIVKFDFQNWASIIRFDSTFT